MIDIVYCDECIHCPIRDEDGTVMPPENAGWIEDTTCPFINEEDYYYNIMPPSDFFCKKGERRKIAVVIKNMKMPKCCADCPFFDEDDACVVTGRPYADTKLGRRMVQCPLQGIELLDDLMYKEIPND